MRGQLEKQMGDVDAPAQVLEDVCSFECLDKLSYRSLFLFSVVMDQYFLLHHGSLAVTYGLPTSCWPTDSHLACRASSIKLLLARKALAQGPKGLELIGDYINLCPEWMRMSRALPMPLCGSNSTECAAKYELF